MSPVILTPDELRAMRKGLKLTQAQLANAVGLTQETISRMEQGHQPMNTITQYGLRAIMRDLAEKNQND